MKIQNTAKVVPFSFSVRSWVHRINLIEKVKMKKWEMQGKPRTFFSYHANPWNSIEKVVR